MKYFKDTENPGAKLPQNFMHSFLEVSQAIWVNSIFVFADIFGHEGSELVGSSSTVYIEYEGITLSSLLSSQSLHSSLHSIHLGCIEDVPGFDKFVRYNIAQLRQII